MTAYWAEHAWLPSGLATSVRLEVDAGRFASVEVGALAQPGDVRLPGVTLPGAANAHSHAFHRALRGRTHGGSGSFWTWREQMYAVAARLDPDTYLALARAAYAEMALAGMTVVGEFHYLHHGPDGRPYDDPNAMAVALVAAASEAGVRLTLLDACYLAGGLGPAGHLPLDPVQRRFSDGTAAGWAQRAGALTSTPAVRIGAAIHSVRAVPREALGQVASAARHTLARDGAAGAPLHVHLSEQPAENEAALAYYGCTPAQLLAAEGVLGPATTAVHATHLTPDDVALLGAAGTSVCCCPTTERDLADGIGQARALRDVGSPLCLGSDQHAVVDPFEDVRGLEMHERLRSGERGRFTPAALLDAFSPNGYAALGWPEGGRLEAGALADFVTVRTDSVRTAGAAPEQSGYAAGAADVTWVVVGGETLVSDGRHRLGDVGRLLADAITAVTAGMPA
ncbi:MAG: formimidoylglutamate deiminase [Dermatophilaceae bacterium]